MAKLIRYALATICLAASVGCLALWGWTNSTGVQFIGRGDSHVQPVYAAIGSSRGECRCASSLVAL